jgi:hypothetical protein
LLGFESERGTILCFFSAGAVSADKVIINVDANDKVHVEARANRNQLIMFSTIIAFIDFLIILRVAVCGDSKAIRSIGFVYPLIRPRCRATH